MTEATVWELGLGETVLARVREIGYEFPWTYGELFDTKAFERYRSCFDPEDFWSETPVFEALLDEVSAAGGFWLRDTATGRSSSA